MGDIAFRKYSGLKKTGIVLLLLTISFIAYVMIINRNSRNMTPRQKLLKAVYPVMMWFAKATGRKTISLSNSTLPLVSFYTLQGILNNGDTIELSDFKGKKILLVNTASDCGYTQQYEGLEKLYREHKAKLVILGFPANDFKAQEKDTDENIASFCKLNFGVSFPIMKKSKVIKGMGQNEIYNWLSHKDKNGWNNQAPAWNFCKYLIDENGILRQFFASSVESMSSEILKAIEE